MKRLSVFLTGLALFCFIAFSSCKSKTQQAEEPVEEVEEVVEEASAEVEEVAEEADSVMAEDTTAEEAE